MKQNFGYYKSWPGASSQAPTARMQELNIIAAS
jgi:hypothetical protein